MSDFNSTHNRAVWFDIPVTDLDRAAACYRAVLAIEVEKSQFDNFSFCVLDHRDENGGCLVPKASEVAANAGVLLYLNVNGRIRQAVTRVAALGGKSCSRLMPSARTDFAPSFSTARAIASSCIRMSMPDSAPTLAV